MSHLVTYHEPMQALNHSIRLETPPASRSLGSNAGFTVIELMVVILIVAVLAALAAPSFTPIIERWRVRDAGESLTSAMYFARSEAIKRGGNVTISQRPNSATCTNVGVTVWKCGWLVSFTSGTVTTVLQQSPEPARTLVTLAGSSSGVIAVDRWGMTSHSGSSGAPANMFFTIIPEGKTITDASSARLCAGMGGRIVSKKGSDTC